MPFELIIVTPDGESYHQPVDTVVLPGSEGDFGILTSHERFLTPLHAGSIQVQPPNGNRLSAAIGDGFADVRGDRVTVLVESCEFGPVAGGGVPVNSPARP